MTGIAAPERPGRPRRAEDRELLTRNLWFAYLRQFGLTAAEIATANDVCERTVWYGLAEARRLALAARRRGRRPENEEADREDA